VTDQVRVLEERYARGLQEHVTGPSELTLHRAYGVGRWALTQGLGILDVVAAHHRAVAVLPDAALSDGRQIVGLLESFLVECLSPFEMAHRGVGEANAALRHLNARLDEEARRIAHALHDEAGQLLATVYLAVAEMAHDLGPTAQERLSGINGSLDQIDEQLRRLAHELRPPMLDELGIIPAIEFLIDGISQRTGLPIHVAGTSGRRLPPPVEIALYRIVQGALNNVVKHAKATRAHVEFAWWVGMVQCAVRDDGIGFEVASAQKRASGLGLIGMRERLDALGGELVIRSVPGQGTVLTATIPLEQPHDNDDSAHR
jgi:signal transduction histidine kinase